MSKNHGALEQNALRALELAARFSSFTQAAENLFIIREPAR
ncbi:hypothetical protein C4K39_4967 [Pseudomonas sessilinigenes]|nr:hypothetical protein C4K39_4967 [Pseudomonas sessilinigenes]